MTKIKKYNKKAIIIGLVALLLVAGVTFILLKQRNNKSETTPAISAQQETINLEPPTAEDKQSVDENKQRIINEQEKAANQPTPPAGSTKTVTPIIAFAEQSGSVVEVSSYVNGIFEDGGKCTARFIKNALSITKEVTATKEGRSVFCPLFSIPASEFAEKGMWSVTVSYSSPSASGSSEAKAVEVR